MLSLWQHSHMDEVSSFGQRLASLLAQRGVTQLELAARVGVTRAAMSRYVSGDREPRFVTLVRIAEELDVHVDELLGTGTGSVDAAVRLVARARLTDEQRASLRQVLDGEM
jgi:transcriptional regulator with XRE-family HTH domain